MKTKMLPNFLIIGAAKSGTSSLFRYLESHPDVYMPDYKEPNFFALVGRPVNFQGPGDDTTINLKSVSIIDDYHNLFKGSDHFQCRGEASTLYLYAENAAENIFSLVPDMRLVCILRNPVDRAFSAYKHLKRDRREFAGSFEEALELESERIEKNWEHLWHYVNQGYYYKQLSRYFSFFKRDQVMILLYEDLIRRNPDEIAKQLWAFLGLKETVFSTRRVFNSSGETIIPFLHDFIVKPNVIKKVLKIILPSKLMKSAGFFLKRVNVRPDEDRMDARTREKLIDIFESDILQLEGLIDKDLKHWLRKEVLR